MVGGNSTTTKAENDFYATDPKTTTIFLETFLQDHSLGNSILECACGEGHMSEVIKEFCKDSEVTSTDLIDRGYGIGGIDFLKHEFENKFDTIMTNPPFSLAKEFIEKGLEVSNKYLILLCKIQLLEGVNRKELLQSSPLKYVYVHSSRQATWKGGQPLDPKGKKWATTMCLAWFVWDKEYQGEPIIKWL